jgi:hypothetical protein
MNEPAWLLGALCSGDEPSAQPCRMARTVQNFTRPLPTELVVEQKRDSHRTLSWCIGLIVRGTTMPGRAAMGLLDLGFGSTVV